MLSGKLFPWMLFFVCLLLLGSAATPVGAVADHLLVSARLALLIGVSVLIVRRSFDSRSPGHARRGNLLRAFERWYRGERA